MNRTIVIDLAGEEDFLVTRKKEDAARKKAQWVAPALELVEVEYADPGATAPDGYRALLVEYFRK